MSRYIAQRMLQLIPLLWAVATLVFFMMRLVPGDPAVTMLGLDSTEEQRAAFRERTGLGGPLHEAYLGYLQRLVAGDLGRSIFYRDDVAALIWRTLPATLELAVAALLLAVALAIPLGVLAAVSRGGFFDRASVLLAVTGAAVPGFWLGVIFITVFAVGLGWLPSSGRGSPLWTIEGLRHLVMPAVTLALALLASTTRLTRSSMLEILSDEYVRTARAKGLIERVVVSRHALPNALIPIVTNIGLQVGALLGGALLIETVFAWPGLGRLGVDAMLRRDYPLIQGVVLASVGLFALTNLVVDLLYVLIDPRIRYR